MNGWVYVLGFIVALTLVLILVPLVKKLAIRMGSVSVPNHRSVHTKPMPLWGGLAIFIAFVGAYFLILPITNFEDKDHAALGLLLGGAVITLVGALDDRYNISPRMKLLGQVIAAAIVASFGLQVDFLNIPFGNEMELSQWISVPITILWIVGVTNAINLIDGLDGLSAGVSGIATATILILALLMGNVPVILLSVLLLGSIIGFLFYNFNPASIFMGDTGALFLGFSLATLSILGFKQATVVTLIVPILILGVPLTDTVIAIVRRKINKVPIFEADKGHLHHCLLGMGFGMRKTVLIIYGISFAFGGCAILLYLLNAQLWVTILLTIAILFVLEVGAEAIGIISKRRKPVIHFFQRLMAINRTYK